mmetsp:Transcript_16011/g.42282  ORF Transcript_16011/g.42282 Transcript_16011/m.42282 type:complete len:174 (+) Transcript_16011:1434-1955(+)
MAFRFRREGDRIKHKVHMERMGMQPWIEDFKWRAVDWHYNYYMGPKARNAIMSNQRAAPKMQEVFEKQSHGFIQKGPSAGGPPHLRTKHFAWTTALPQTVPYHKSTNPFCSVTPNKTGWREYVEHANLRGAVRPESPKHRQHRIQHIMDPKPKGDRGVVSGTDDTVPVMPNQD